MTEQNYITSYCKINANAVFINGDESFINKEHLNKVDFLKSAYKHYEISYPKFYKMDSLCKLAFVASELLMKTNKLTDSYNKEDIAIIISNSASSLETDTEHQKTIQETTNFFPSPAVFVYTLPNILIGEIAIRNTIQGENTFFIFDKFDGDFNVSYINTLLNTNKAKSCIAGWVDFYEENMEAFLFTVEKNTNKKTIEFNDEQLTKLYNN